MHPMVATFRLEVVESSARTACLNHCPSRTAPPVGPARLPVCLSARLPVCLREKRILSLISLSLSLSRTLPNLPPYLPRGWNKHPAMASPTAPAPAQARSLPAHTHRHHLCISCTTISPNGLLPSGGSWPNCTATGRVSPPAALHSERAC